MSGGRVMIDAEACIACGACLFACPSQALAGEACKRILSGNTLVTGDDVLAPHPNELLQWVVEEGIGSVAVAGGELSGRWLGSVLAANGALEAMGRNLLRIEDMPAGLISAQGASRREFFRLRPKADGPDRRCVSLEPGRLSALYPDASFHHVALDRNSCTLCGACARICKPGAVGLVQDDDAALVIDHGLCTGCRLCADTCLEQALQVMPQIETRRVEEHAVFLATCDGCSRPYHAWKADGGRCHICNKRADLYGGTVL